MIDNIDGKKINILIKKHDDSYDHNTEWYFFNGIDGKNFIIFNSENDIFNTRYEKNLTEKVKKSFNDYILEKIKNKELANTFINDVNNATVLIMAGSNFFYKVIANDNEIAPERLDSKEIKEKISNKKAFEKFLNN